MTCITRGSTHDNTNRYAGQVLLTGQINSTLQDINRKNVTKREFNYTRDVFLSLYNSELLFILFIYIFDNINTQFNNVKNLFAYFILPECLLYVCVFFNL